MQEKAVDKPGGVSFRRQTREEGEQITSTTSTTSTASTASTASKSLSALSAPPKLCRLLRKSHVFKKNHADETRQDLNDCISSIESILEGPAASALTPLQIAAITGLRSKVNLAASSGHTLHRSRSTASLVPNMVIDDLPKSQSSAFIASNFGGLDIRRGRGANGCKKFSITKSLNTTKLVKNFTTKLRRASDDRKFVKLDYAPPEWTHLSAKSRAKLARILSWESLSKWGFDALEVAELTIMGEGRNDDKTKCYQRNGHKPKKCCPLLIIGWAILGSPYSQNTMQKSIQEANSSEIKSGERSGYGFFDYFELSPETLCSFLRAVEGEYQEVPYHNSTHAADVLQTTHALIQYAGDDLGNVCTGLDTYSILLAAVVHDTGHPGTNNNFQVRAQTDDAILYNDRSVLENVHAAKAFQLLIGPSKKPGLDVLGGLDPEAASFVRRNMIDAVLATDMTQHFSHMAHIEKVVSTLRENMDPGGFEKHEAPSVLKFLPESEEKDKIVEEILRFILHLADLSNPTKPHPVFVKWADLCLAEFFAQGDKEKSMGFPISPLCDRKTTSRAESQLGFVKFVVLPSYEMLAHIIPRVAKEVLPVIDANIQYWEEEQKNP